MIRKLWSTLFRRVRWSDGTVASFLFDHVAWGLLMLSAALEILGMAVAWGLFDAPVLGLATMLPAGLALVVAANLRLRLAVDRAEREGVGGRDASVPVSLRWLANFSGWQARFAEWGARRCDLSEQKFLARADSAAAKGDHRSAAKYRDRAARERRYADFTRRRA